MPGLGGFEVDAAVDVFVLGAGFDSGFFTGPEGCFPAAALILVGFFEAGFGAGAGAEGFSNPVLGFVPVIIDLLAGGLDMAAGVGFDTLEGVVVVEDLVLGAAAALAVDDGFGVVFGGGGAMFVDLGFKALAGVAVCAGVLGFFAVAGDAAFCAVVPEPVLIGFFVISDLVTAIAGAFWPGPE